MASPPGQPSGSWKHVRSCPLLLIPGSYKLIPQNCGYVLLHDWLWYLVQSETMVLTLDVLEAENTRRLVMKILRARRPVGKRAKG